MSISVTVAIVACATSFIFGMWSLNRERNKDMKNESSQLTTIVVKLESISTGVTEIKHDVTNVKDEMKEIRERLTITEQRSASAHHRIDDVCDKCDTCVRRLGDMQ
jgi:peptidoglycan hydrolase CwlO-like protein